MTMTESINIERVRSLLGEKELLCQLAEECAELSKAALKVRRVIDGTNPTPISGNSAWANFYEEVADVLIVLQCLNVRTDDPAIKSVQESKAVRWVSRLEDRK